MDQPRSILIVKLGAVGDCIHTLVAMRALRRAFPEATLGWLVEGKSKEVVLGHPDLNHVHIWNRKQASLDFRRGRVFLAWQEIRRVIEELRNVTYDVAIDFQNLFKSGFFTWQSKAPQRIGFSRLREGNFLFTNRQIKTDFDGHMVYRYLSLLEPLGVSVAEKPPAVPIFVPEEKKAGVDEYFAGQLEPDARVIALNPAASLKRKLWPAARFAQVADELAKQFHVAPLIIWGPDEKPLAEKIVNTMRENGRLAPPTTIKELAYLLSRCELYIGNDTGPMHLAAAMGAGVVGLFGPSDPARVGPWTSRARAVEPKRAFSQQRKMEEITVEQVVAAAGELLEG